MAHGLIQNIQQNVDIGATAYFLGAQATGHYSLAYRLADLPYAAFTEPVAAVTFPALARSHRRRESTSELGLQLLTVVTVFTCPVCLLMSAAAGPLVAVAFGDKWGPMAGALSVLGCWAAIVQVEAALGWFLNSLGLASINAAVSAAVLVPLLPAVMIAAANGGIVAVAWVMLAAGVATTALLVVRVRRATGLPVRRQLRAIAGTTVAGVALWACARAIVGALSDADALSTLLLATAGGLGVYILVLRLLDPGSLRIGLAFAVDAVRNLRGQSPT
jgi:PST family polysaccharide transporter